MSQIHELLPALNEAEKIDKGMHEETIKVFQKGELLEGFDKILKMHDDDRKQEEPAGCSRQALTTSIKNRLNYLSSFQIRNLDAQFQRELSNAQALATLTLPGGAKIDGVPVCFLMFLEKYLMKYRNLLEMAPTYDTTVRWQEDTQNEIPGVRVTQEPDCTNKTEKKKEPVTLAPATKEHQAKVELFEKDIVVGLYSKHRITGKWSPAEKKNALQACDDLILEVKQAKARANKTDVVLRKIGEELIKSILNSI